MTRQAHLQIERYVDGSLWESHQLIKRTTGKSLWLQRNDGPLDCGQLPVVVQSETASSGTFQQTVMNGRSLPYWLAIQAPILAIAALMSQVGAYVWMVYPNALFRPLELILPSCLTWLLLAPFVSGASNKRAVMIGLLSPVVGSVFVIWLRRGPVTEIASTGFAGFSGAFFYAILFIVQTSWITLPVGILTSLLIRRVFELWPPPKATVSN